MCDSISEVFSQHLFLSVNQVDQVQRACIAILEYGSSMGTKYG